MKPPDDAERPAPAPAAGRASSRTGDRPPEAGGDERKEHGARVYVRTFAVLLVLTTLTLGLTFVELGAAGPASALVIAFAKAVLVALFFMHLVEHRTSSWLTLLVAALLAGTLVTLAVLDVATRATG